ASLGGAVVAAGVGFFEHAAAVTSTAATASRRSISTRAMVAPPKPQVTELGSRAQAAPPRADSGGTFAEGVGMTLRQELQAANDALKRADELKNTFLRTVSHDVRSPITAVLSA